MEITKVKFDNGMEATESRHGGASITVSVEGAARVKEEKLGEMDYKEVTKLNQDLVKVAKAKRLSEKANDDTIPKEPKNEIKDTKKEEKR